MSWRNTDRAFGSRARGLRGIDGSVVGVSGLSGFVAPGTVPIMRWRNTDRAWGNRPRGLPHSGPTGWGLRGLGQETGGTPEEQQIPIDTAGGAYSSAPYYIPDITGQTSAVTPVSSSTVQTIQNIAQQGYQDAFNILKLLNPVPPGTVMQTTPYGSFISRAAAGQPAPAGSLLPTGAGAGGSLLLVVGVGLVIFLVARGGK